MALAVGAIEDGCSLLQIKLVVEPRIKCTTHHAAKRIVNHLTSSSKQNQKQILFFRYEQNLPTLKAPTKQKCPQQRRAACCPPPCLSAFPGAYDYPAVSFISTSRFPLMKCTRHRLRVLTKPNPRYRCGVRAVTRTTCTSTIRFALTECAWHRRATFHRLF